MAAPDAAQNHARAKVVTFGGTTLTVDDASVFGSTPFYVTLWPKSLHADSTDAALQTTTLAERLRVTAKDTGANTLTLSVAPTIDTALSADYYVEQSFGAEEYTALTDRMFKEQVSSILTTTLGIDLIPSGSAVLVTEAILRLVRSALAADNIKLSLQSGTSGVAGIAFGDSVDAEEAEIRYDNANNRWEVLIDGNVRFRISESGSVLINERSLSIVVTGGAAEMKIDGGTDSTSQLNLGDTAAGPRGRIRYDNTTDTLEFDISETVLMSLLSTGLNLTGDLGVTGDLNLTGDLSVTGNSVFTGAVSYTEGAELTIANADGSITATDSNHTVDTDSDEASDNLDTINGMPVGSWLVLRAANGARTVRIRDSGIDGIGAAANINVDPAVGTYFDLDTTADMAVLYRHNSSKWTLVHGFSSN